MKKVFNALVPGGIGSACWRCHLEPLPGVRCCKNLFFFVTDDVAQ